MLNINKSLPCKAGFYGGKRSTTKYIVWHYTGNKKDSAKNNATFFSKNITGSKRSAQLFVDETEIYQSVDLDHIAYSVGGGVQSSHHPYYGICTNSNSINIELCTSGDYTVSQKTIDNAIELTKYLMNKYNVPVENVIRHYDVNGKMCPDTNLRNETTWANIKAIINGTPAPTAKQSTAPKPTTVAATTGDSWVKSLQKELNNQYKSGLVVDGIGGPKTLAACPTVRQGARGNITRLIQQRLNSVGFSLVCDGDFGSKTKNAVVVFQKNRGLSQDGIVGKNTWTWLLKGTKK